MNEYCYVIIAFNEAGNIAETIEAITGQESVGATQIVVVDDGSTDGTGAVVRRIQAKYPQLQLVQFESNRGRGAARVAGIAAARARYVALVDADITLGPDWTRRCREFLERFHVSGGIAVPDGDVSFVHRVFGLEPKAFPHPMPVTGSNALYRREVFDVVRFDPERRNGEDIDLAFQLQAAGMSTTTVPGLIVQHREVKSLKDTISWLYESGVGASRQLYERRAVRTPDLAFFAMMASSGLAVSLRARRRLSSAKSAMLPLGVLMVGSVAHLHSKFKLPATPMPSVAAIPLDALLLSSYYSGRAVGVFTQFHRRSVSKSSVS